MNHEEGKGAPDRRPFSLGGPRIIIAVEDASVVEFANLVRKTLGERGGKYVVVPASALANPHLESDFYFGAHKPSAPGRTRLFQTTSLETYEQAPNGAIFRNALQVWPEAPVAVGRPTTQLPGPLVRGEDAAFLFVTGPHMRITVTGPILLLCTQPTTKPGRLIAGWLETAREAIAPVPELS